MAYPSIKLVEEIVDLFNKSGASELEFSDATLKFRIRRGEASVAAADRDTAAIIPASDDRQPRDIVPPTADLAVISFLHGVFHHAPAPGEQPFVSIGSKVLEGQQLGILEAMKVFMPIVCPADGVVTHIHVENGVEVTTGQPLFTVSPSMPGDAA
jgi:acetyl-CoA carboxylase biotin carboxyl carrier protein